MCVCVCGGGGWGGEGTGPPAPLLLEREERMEEKRKQQCLHPVFKLTAQLKIVFERHVLHEDGL